VNKGFIMPIIIDEIVISVEISNKTESINSQSPVANENKILVAECVERVLEILRQREQ
jgi:hypothetical protein